MVPIAAASLGQVHKARLIENKDGIEQVAIKIQYPGVKESIDSDVQNLKRMLTYTSIFPKQMFVDQIIEVSRKELIEECDYLTESYKQTKMRQLIMETKELKDHVYVPKVIEELTSDSILTSEFINGLSLDYVAQNGSQELRNHIGQVLMEVTLQQLFRFRFLQSDPNPANFSYNPSTKKLQMIDFGAATQYSKEFMDIYIEIVYAAATKNYELCLEKSIEIGFLSGEENRAMQDAHCESIMIAGEPFRWQGQFDWGDQQITQKVYELFPVIVKNRLKQPPVQTYSLNRLLSGCFLFSVQLRSKYDARDMFFRVYHQYRNNQ